jgi:hypothetical protein
MPDFPTSLIDFQRRFLDEAACAAWLFEARWPAGFRCPACAHEKGWPHGGKPFTYECAACGKQTSVTAGTIMHGSKLSLTVWFWAAYLMATHSNGISALQLQKQLALGSYKSAWLLCAKLRRAMVAPGRTLLSGVAEVDETELPLRGKDDPVTGGGGRSGQGKMLVAGAVEVADGVPGRIRLAKISDFSAKSLHGFVAANMSPPARSSRRRPRRKHSMLPKTRRSPHNGLWSSSDDASSGRKPDSVNHTIILGDDHPAAKPPPPGGPLRHLDHAAFERNRSNAENVIDSRELEALYAKTRFPLLRSALAVCRT